MLKPLNLISIVLVEPSHPGNIGAVARAMKTMGLSDLRLVKPKRFPDEAALRRAAGADDVLAQARVYESLSDALTGTRYVVGTSVRAREVNWPLLNPRECAEQVLSLIEAGSVLNPHGTSSAKNEAESKIALVFGRESSGLTNAELDQTDVQLKIPSDPTYGSLNLASAVQIVCYELRVGALERVQDLPDDHVSEEALTRAQIRQMPASKAEREQHLEHLFEVLEALKFAKSNSSSTLQRKLTRIYNKAELTTEEVQLLRGILTAVSQKNATRNDSSG